MEPNMPLKAPSFTLGIEEEYLIIDKKTRDLVIDPPKNTIKACIDSIKGQVSPEFMRSQMEVGTLICKDIGEARKDLKNLRKTLNNILNNDNMALISASAHPFADWKPQKHTNKSRYKQLAKDLGAPIQRLLTNGMHVHLGIEDNELRIDLINQARYFLPHLLALSTSSPFWQGQDTGLKSYRLSVFRSLPRTGLPQSFQSYAEYQRHIDALIDVGVIEDATKIWWDMRPSARFPTVEMRICDACTNIEDTLSIAAIYQSIMRRFYRFRRDNITWRKYKSMLIDENRWRAQRYGLDEGLIDYGLREILPFSDIIEELITLITPDAKALNCEKEILHAKNILKNGTSAHKQINIYNTARAEGATKKEAQIKIVDWLIKETASGIE